jgi:hypothetical protein
MKGSFLIQSVLHGVLEISKLSLVRNSLGQSPTPSRVSSLKTMEVSMKRIS